MKTPEQTKDLPLMLAAVLTMCLVVSRAAIQSATLDEASSYLGYCALPWPSHWYPTSGNHVLNSLVCRLFNTVFGLSHLSFRSGAILGAALYLVAAYRLCVVFVKSSWIRWPLWFCLTLNPFILDYLVAARGYGLALGLLMTAVLAGARVIAGIATVRNCALASVCVALSFTASFPFAFPDLAIILLLWGWCLLRHRNRVYALTAACFVPGLLVTIVVAGSVLHEWPKGQLYYGAHNVKEMWHSLVASSLFELNPQVVNPLVRPVLTVIGQKLPNAFYALSIALLLALAVRSYAAGSGNGILARFAKYLFGVLALSFTLYWLSHRLFHLLYPMERTGVFFVVLATLWFGMATALQPVSRLGSVIRMAAITALYAGAVYFAGCLRLTYFKEWKFDADVKTAFEVVLDQERKSGTHDLATSWEFSDSLKFYDLYYRHDPPFHYYDMIAGSAPLGKAIYLLNFEGYHDFIEKEKLVVLYHGEPSDTVVAIRP